MGSRNKDELTGTEVYQAGAAGWRETRNLFPLDQRLRRHGFTIHARPKRGPATWNSPYGSVLTLAEALEDVAEIEKDCGKG